MKKVITFILFALTSSLHGQELELETFRKSFTSNQIKVTFQGDPVSYFYYKKQVNMEFGTSQVSFRGKLYWIPSYVVNVRNASNAALAYFQSKGFEVTIPDWVLIEKAFAPDESVKGAFGNTWRQPFQKGIFIKPYLSKGKLFTTVAHEWFHAAQHETFGVSPYLNSYHMAFVEGSAEWASDLPIIVKDAHGISQQGKTLTYSPSTSRNKVNIDLIDSYEGRIKELIEPAARTGEAIVVTEDDDESAYNFVAMWKLYCQKVGTGEDEADAMIGLGDSFSDYSNFNKENFINAVSENLPDAGNGKDKFGAFFEDYVKALTTLDSGGEFKLKDNLFKNSRLTMSSNRSKSFHRHYSKRPESIPESDARNQIERHQRLETIAYKSPPIKFLGFDVYNIELRDRTVATEPVYKRTGIFLETWKDVPDKFSAASAFIHNDPNALQRRTKYKMDALGFTLQNKPYASTYFSNFNNPSSARRIVLGVGNCNPKLESAAFNIAYAVTPFFYKFSPQSELSGSEDREVQLLRAEPEKNIEQDGFTGGDKLVFQVYVSDPVHIGGNSNIDEKNRTLSAKIYSSSNKEIEVADLSVDYIEAKGKDNAGKVKKKINEYLKHSYEISFKLPEGLNEFGNYKLKLSLSSLLRLGEDDKNETDISFKIEGARPAVTSVLIYNQENELIQSETHNRIRPLIPGNYKIEVNFDKEMKPGEEGEAFLINSERVQGSWRRNNKTWTTKYNVPESLENKGVKQLSVQAKSVKNLLVDTDKNQTGEQPYEQFFFVVDTPPTFLKSVQAMTGKGPVYDAVWNGPSEPDDMENWTLSFLENPNRELKYEVRDEFEEGTLSCTLYFEFSDDLKRVPEITLDGESLEVEAGSRKSLWSARLIVDKFIEKHGAGKGYVLKISAEDKYGKKLDADPATIAALKELTDINEKDWWQNYESEFSGPHTGQGGPDEWHELNSEKDAVWYGKDTTFNDQYVFSLVERGNNLLMVKGSLKHRGSRNGDKIHVKANAVLQDDLNKTWHDTDTYEITDMPAVIIREAFSRYRSQMYYEYDMKKVTGKEYVYEGDFGSHTVSHQDGKLHSVSRKNRWTVHQWTPADKEEVKENENRSFEEGDLKITENGEAYWLEERRSGGLILLDVYKASYRRFGLSKARLVVSSFPVSYAVNHNDGKKAWKIQWGSARNVSADIALKSAKAQKIKADFKALEAENMSIGEIRAEIEKRLD